MEERLICSANLYPNGKIYRGHRHGDCFRAAAGAGQDSFGAKQGFMTSRNRWVDRVEAYRIAKESGQWKDCGNGDIYQEMFSENLYLY